MSKKYIYRGFQIEITATHFLVNGRSYYRANLVSDEAELAFAMRLINNALGPVK